jgi:rod shape determining protein RodA
MQTLRLWRHFDYTMLAITLVLVIFGVMMIRSATIDVESLADRVPRQIIYGVAGMVIVLVLAAIDYRLLTSAYQWLYGTIMLLLVIVDALGVIGEAGAQRWLNLGIIPLQPSELAKIVMIIALAQHLSNNWGQMHRLGKLFGSLVFVAGPVVFVFAQPDLSNAILLVVIWFVMVWAAGMRWRHILTFVLLGLLILPLVWTQMEPYQQARIATFLGPIEGRGATYNIEQALISIGSGGLLGKGYAQGTQSQLRFLRVRHTDFIFAVIAEELGLVGAVAVLILFAALLFRILRGAQIASDTAGSLICYGVAGLIFFQTTVSIGMNVNLLPVTGLTLPFISSGGSSLIALLMGIGLVESVVMHTSTPVVDSRWHITDGG